MFIIPCKFDKNNPIIFECVEKIRQTHPHERIVVVDSDSDDKGYFKDLGGVTIYSIDNRNYATNAYYSVWKDYPDEGYYFCIQDSLLVNQSLSHLKDQTLVTVRHFNCPPTPIGWDANGHDLSGWASEQMDMHMRMKLPDSYTGVFGPMWFCKGEVLAALNEIGLFKIKPENKYQLCAIERIVGVAMTACGFNPANSLQGEMLDFYGDYDSSLVRKVHLARW